MYLLTVLNIVKNFFQIAFKKRCISPWLANSYLTIVLNGLYHSILKTSIVSTFSGNIGAFVGVKNSEINSEKIISELPILR